MTKVLILLMAMTKEKMVRIFFKRNFIVNNWDLLSIASF